MDVLEKQIITSKSNPIYEIALIFGPKSKIDKLFVKTQCFSDFWPRGASVAELRATEAGNALVHAYASEQRQHSAKN